MTKTKHNKTYNQDLTKRRKSIRSWQIQVGLLALTLLITSLLGIKWFNLHTEEWQDTFIKPAQANGVMATPELTIKEYVLQEVEKAGIDTFKVRVLIEMCENKAWNPDAKYVNRHSNGSVTIDRGIWMINDYYHSEVSNLCAYDYKCSTKEAIRIIQERGFKEWSCGVTYNL